MSASVRAFAPAKVNLSLSVHGRRADGYHELTSLVVFADVGDTLTLEPSREFRLSVTGPTAQQIDGPNLISKAAARLYKLAPDVAPGAITLHKLLPVGAGVGGGSSDVAAYLRAVRSANPDHADHVDWLALATELGADVPVCLEGKSRWMCGIGERLVARDGILPPLHAVLVNPRIAIATGPVFQELAAPPFDKAEDAKPFPNLLHGLTALLALTNDLEAPARRLVPEINRVRKALEVSEGVKLVRMSGSGATYFGIYETRDAAQAASVQISAQHPEWWVVPTVLGDAPRDDEIVNSPG